MKVDGAPQLIGYDSFPNFGLSGFQFPQRSTLSRQLAIGQQYKFTAIPLQVIDFDAKCWCFKCWC